MNNIVKFQYTTGVDGLFSLSGLPYIGYVNTVSGNAYAGKYTQDVLLTNNDTVQTSVITSDTFFNRLISQNFSLTYSLSDFVFGSNEFINANSFNLKLAKMQQNYLDAYRAGFIGSSNLPSDFVAMALLSAVAPLAPIFWNTDSNFWNLETSLWATGNVFVWASSGLNLTANIPLSAGVAGLTTTCRIAYLPNNFFGNTLVVAGSGSLFVFNISDPTTFNLTFSSSFVSTNTLDSNQLAFVNITCLSYANNTFYICDSGAGKIYQYDVTSVLNQDRVFGSKFNLINIIDGMQGSFTTPTLVEADDSAVFVYDASNGTINFYDQNFNLINAYRNKKLFSISTPVSITYYKLYNQLFVLTTDFKLIVLDSEANSTIIQLNTTNINPGEIANKLIFSNSYSDVFYLLSNQALYKFFVSNPAASIGQFSFITNSTILIPIWNLDTLLWNNAFELWNYNGINPNVQIAGNQLYDIATYDSGTVPYDDIILFAFNGFLNYNEVMQFNSIIKA